MWGPVLWVWGSPPRPATATHGGVAPQNPGGPQHRRAGPRVPPPDPPPEDPKTPRPDPPSPAEELRRAPGPQKSGRGTPPSPRGGPPKSPRETPKTEGGPPFPRRLPGGAGVGSAGAPKPDFWGVPAAPPPAPRLRNRRYAALRQLIRGLGGPGGTGDYFSEEEMRAREPLLYQHYIGQYRGAEPPPPAQGGPPNFSGSPPAPPPTLTELLLRSVDEAAVQRRLRRQRLRDGDDEEGDPPPDPQPPDEAERAMLRQEFTTRMYQRFLDGEDPDFDYSQVDDNPDLDNLDIVSRDAEERYFDEEEPSDAPQLD
ncbi:LOW QUALITY PROTEIN: coiled-coil domain-containing protein 97 [Opisthocomus hoazin]|uniref:LOW QUALITY PROTEIN: coiled-coil domain-containing protein 97 n=1 Tax=Opisthocomus hoazin TaxID=30419 RepID=UPI003F52CE56